MLSSRNWIVALRLLWSVALLATLCLVALALAAIVPAQNASEIQATLRRSAEGELRISPAWNGGVARAGVYEGDVLVAINGQPVSTVDQATALLNRAVGGSVTLTVRTGNFPDRQVIVLPKTDTRRMLGTLGLSGETSTALGLAADLVFAVVCAGTALLVAWKKWNDGFALLVSLTLVVVLLGGSVPVVLLYQSASVWRPALAVWLMVVFGLVLAFFYLFPSGQFVPRQTRWLMTGVTGWILLGLFNTAVYPWEWSLPVYALVLIGSIGTGVFAQVYRYRALARIEEKQQIRWVVFGSVAAVLGMLLQILPRSFGINASGALDLVYSFLLYPLGYLLKFMLPISIGFAILRYRLWDIDLVVNRTLVYGALTVSVIALYALGVGLLGALLQTTNNLFVSLVMTGIVAVVFQPLRERLQRGVNRLMFGQRDEPYTVVAQLGKRLETTVATERVLPALVETIGQALKLPYVAIETGAGETGEIAAAYGHVAPRVVRLPMQYQSETVGYLAVAPRRPAEPLSAADLQLLTTIAQQTGAAVHAVQLTADLRRSRERLIMAREEERRRIRRDLHDGLGPVLAALAMEADTARELAHTDAKRTQELLRDIIVQAQTAIQDVRRLVYDLRPPALDEMGLAGALTQHAAALSGQLHMTIDAPAPFPPLPAAVEVAAYRIAQEALNNVVRHSRGQNCTLRLAVSDALELEISDDGAGIPSGARSGVGLISMRERAGELGGTCVIESSPGGGTRVTARIPVNNT